MGILVKAKGLQTVIYIGEFPTDSSYDYANAYNISADVPVNCIKSCKSQLSMTTFERTLSDVTLTFIGDGQGDLVIPYSSYYDLFSGPDTVFVDLYSDGVLQFRGYVMGVSQRKQNGIITTEANVADLLHYLDQKMANYRGASLGEIQAISKHLLKTISSRSIAELDIDDGGDTGTALKGHFGIDDVYYPGVPKSGWLMLGQELIKYTGWEYTLEEGVNYLTFTGLSREQKGTVRELYDKSKLIILEEIDYLDVIDELEVQVNTSFLKKKISYTDKVEYKDLGTRGAGPVTEGSLGNSSAWAMKTVKTYAGGELVSEKFAEKPVAELKDFNTLEIIESEIVSSKVNLKTLSGHMTGFSAKTVTIDGVDVGYFEKRIDSYTAEGQPIYNSNNLDYFTLSFYFPSWHCPLGFVKASLIESTGRSPFFASLVWYLLFSDGLSPTTQAILINDSKETADEDYHARLIPLNLLSNAQVRTVAENYRFYALGKAGKTLQEYQNPDSSNLLEDLIYHHVSGVNLAGSYPNSIRDIHFFTEVKDGGVPDSVTEPYLSDGEAAVMTIEAHYTLGGEEIWLRTYKVGWPSELMNIYDLISAGTLIDTKVFEEDVPVKFAEQFGYVSTTDNLTGDNIRKITYVNQNDEVVEITVYPDWTFAPDYNNEVIYRLDYTPDKVSGFRNTYALKGTEIHKNLYARDTITLDIHDQKVLSFLMKYAKYLLATVYLDEDRVLHIVDMYNILQGIDTAAAVALDEDAIEKVEKEIFSITEVNIIDDGAIDNISVKKYINEVLRDMFNRYYEIFKIKTGSTQNLKERDTISLGNRYGVIISVGKEFLEGGQIMSEYEVIMLKEIYAVSIFNCAYAGV